MRGQPLRQHDLLLVAARQSGADDVEARGAHAQPLESTSSASARSARPVDEAEPRQPAERRRASCCCSALIDSTSPCRLRSSGTKPMPSAHRLARRLADRDRARRARDRARSRRVEPEERLRDLGAAGADQPGEPEDLAGANRERDVLEPAGTASGPRRAAAPRRGAACTCAREVLVERPADHQLHQRRLVESRDRLRGDVAAVAQHRDRVAQAEDLLHAVRHVDARSRRAPAAARSAR